MHNLIIWGLIVIIVVVQAYVFKMTLNKIKIYKNILPNQDNFTIVKVFLKESEIETISLVSIFKNLENYSQIREKRSSAKKYDNELVNQIKIQPKIELNTKEFDYYNEEPDDSEITHNNEHQINGKNNEIQFP